MLSDYSHYFGAYFYSLRSFCVPSLNSFNETILLSYCFQYCPPHGEEHESIVQSSEAISTSSSEILTTQKTLLQLNGIELSETLPHPQKKQNYHTNFQINKLINPEK
jgi:hypothetical protein